MQYRAAHIVEERMKQMEDAIHKRDFQLYGELTMRVPPIYSFFSFFTLKTKNNFIL
jgi:mevalonate pyrophosphate decarboxylase